MVIMAIIKTVQTINAGEGVKKMGTLQNYWYECKLVQPLWRTRRRFLKKIKTELYNPAISLLSIYPEKL